MRAALLLGLGCVLVLGIGAGPAEKDPVKLAPEYYKVLLDNDQVRVLDVHLPAGGHSPMHAHPAYIIYALSGGKARFTAPDGKTADMEMAVGQTVWRAAESHAVDNTGDTEIHVLNVELKQPAMAQMPATQPIHAAMMQEHVVALPADIHWGQAPAGLPPGPQFAVLSGDPSSKGLFVARFKVARDYKIPPHFHPTDEQITVISGTFFMGEGDKWDMNSGKELPAGGYALMPAGAHHFAFVKAGSEVQIAGPGPFQITYINPADDPRNGK